MKPRNYISVFDLSHDERQEFADTDSVELADGSVYVAWQVDAIGTQWLKLSASDSVATTPQLKIIRGVE